MANRTRSRLIMLLMCLVLTLCAVAQVETGDETMYCATNAVDKGYRVVKLDTDTLPSLNIPRSGHVTLCVDGELTVFGGHSDGFVPTATAEYMRDGSWHVVPMVYAHDHGTTLQLRSGKVMLAGGHREPLGIGQLYSVEFYDPATHSSQGLGCMDHKRAYANAIEMADGQVIIVGNWYEEDVIEMFSDVYDPLSPNAVEIKKTSIARATPYILRISEDDAIIFGSLDNTADPIDCGIVDRLKDKAYREPFLDTWNPIPTINVRRSLNQFIGNEAEGRYEWLLPVKNDKGQVAIARLTGPNESSDNATFTLLRSVETMPDSINGKAICYSSLICNQEKKLAYLIGDNDEARIFVVAIPYEDTEDPLTVYITEPQPILARDISPVLMPEGDLVFVGGHLLNNFMPSNTAIRLLLGRESSSALTTIAGTGGLPWWLWLLIASLICGIIAALLIVRRNKTTITLNDEKDEHNDMSPLQNDTLTELFRRIEQLMEEERLYLNTNLRASDVAVRLGTNIAYVSASINSQRGCSFTQYLTAHRIAYAQKLMREDPERKISTVSALAGFSTDSTFFRAFRAVTGMTPKEWLSTISDNQKP